MTPARGRRLLQALRVAVSAGLIAWLATMVDWARLRDLVAGADVGLLLVAPVVMTAAFFFAGLRWVVLLRARGLSFGPGRSLAIYLVGAFYNVVLPGAISGDVVRIGLAKWHTGGGLGVVTGTVLVERGCGVVSVFLLGCAAIVFLPEPVAAGLGAPFLRTLVGVTAAGVAVAVAAYALVPATAGLRARVDDRPVLGRAARLIAGALSDRPATLAKVLLATAAFQTVDTVGTWIACAGLGIEVPLPLLFVASPAVYVATALPISLGGLGVREGVMAWILGRAAVGSSDAIALAFLIYAARVIAAAAGGVVQLLGWAGRRPAEPIPG